MPSLEHNALVEMLRGSPELVPHLLELLHIPVPAYRSVAVSEANLDQLLPTEYRADLVVELQGPEGTLGGAIVVEVQLGVDSGKKYSWPVYAVAIRARKRCPACVLVVAPEAGVASWAAEPIDIGLGSGALSPRVLGPAQVPRITTVDEALQQPALAILSARAHGNEADGLQVVTAALCGLERMDPEAAGYTFTSYMKR